ncbi:hypothetical protein CHARACLAT_014793 [Characodon lateralis]|uniref:Uncharacterized protein n=1 Tax=Characodon lateralis TaxID=208331 RepID=A0ABU7D8V0_9TELE|nr:hypothetical protein [Characodon lateralis]
MIMSCSGYKFVDCTTMMQYYCSTTSQRGSVGLRSGGCGGHWNTVKSLPFLKKLVGDDLSCVALCGTMHHLAGNSHQKMGTVTVLKKMTYTISNNTYTGQGV